MMGAAEESIPEFLLRRLEDARPFLKRDGSVQRVSSCAPNRWRLRYREDNNGAKRHRSVLLGDWDRASAVKMLIAGWREEARLDDERIEVAGRAAEAERRRKEAERQAYRRAVVELAGGGRVRRRKTAKMFDEAAKSGPSGVLAFVMDEKWNRPNPKAGRPGKSGLW